GLAQLGNDRGEPVGDARAVEAQQRVGTALEDELARRLDRDVGLALAVLERELQRSPEDAPLPVDLVDRELDALLRELPVRGRAARHDVDRAELDGLWLREPVRCGADERRRQGRQGKVSRAASQERQSEEAWTR